MLLGVNYAKGLIRNIIKKTDNIIQINKHSKFIICMLLDINLPEGIIIFA